MSDDYLRDIDVDALVSTSKIAAARNAVEDRRRAAERIEWLPIRPLPTTDLLPVQPFDMALLPATLRPWAADIAERMQCPGDFIGVTVMAALGAVIGRRVGVRPKEHDDWTEYANQWACVIGRPSVMKSPAMKAALAPLHRLQAEANAEHEFAMKSFNEEQELHELRADAVQKQYRDTLKKNPLAKLKRVELDEPQAPFLRRYLVNDATVEALLDICIENPQGVGVFRDELVSLLRSLDREGQESARGFYLTGWNGNDAYTVDRIGRGRNNRADAVCLSVVGSTQPGRIRTYLRDAITDTTANDGLIQRFGLMVWPDVSSDWEDVDKAPDDAKRNAAFAVFKRLAEADPLTAWGAERVLDYSGQPEDGAPPFVRLDVDALAMFRDWRAEWEPMLRAGTLHPALESHFAKYRKLVPGLALICHLVDAGHGPIRREAMARALGWADYLKSHAMRAYGAGMTSPLDRARTLLEKIREGKLTAEPFALKAVYRPQWSTLTTQEEAFEAVTVLIEYGYLAEQPDAVARAKGRPREPRYVINPEALK